MVRRGAWVGLAFGLSGGCILVENYGDYSQAPADASAADAHADGTTSCEVATDCPGSDTECVQRTCIAGGCSVKNSPKGDVYLQSPGDCKSRTCDGNGHVVEMFAEDPPSDGNPCTLEKCVDGNASADPAPPSTICGDGLVCNDVGQCTGCSSDGQCGACMICSNSTCGPAPGGTKDPSCVPTSCALDTCDGAGKCAVAPFGAECAPQFCDGTELVAPQCDGAGNCAEARHDCGTTPCTPNGACMGCMSKPDCPGSFTCQNGSCVDCVSCSEALTGKIKTGFCPGDSKNRYDAVVQCCKVGKCVAACGGIVNLCGATPGPATSTCLSCLNANCSALGDCVNDPA